MPSSLPWDLGLMLPEQPIPKFIRDAHRVRLLEWNFWKAGDFDIANDWTLTLTGTGTQDRAVPSTTLSAVCLRLTSATTNDGAVAVQNLKSIAMPTTAQGTIFYLAFECALPSATTNLDCVFGIASGTPAQVFDPTTKAVLSAGAGILIRRTAASNLWELFYKTAAGTLLTLASVTQTMAATNFYRVGFLVCGDPQALTLTSIAIGRVIPFLTPLAASGQAGGDDLGEMPQSAFFPSSGGFALDRTAHSDAASTNCGIAMGAAGAGAGARALAIRRIVYADNLRR